MVQLRRRLLQPRTSRRGEDRKPATAFRQLQTSHTPSPVDLAAGGGLPTADDTALQSRRHCRHGIFRGGFRWQRHADETGDPRRPAAVRNTVVARLRRHLVVPCDVGGDGPVEAFAAGVRPLRARAGRTGDGGDTAVHRSTRQDADRRSHGAAADDTTDGDGGGSLGIRREDRLAAHRPHPARLHRCAAGRPARRRDGLATGSVGTACGGFRGGSRPRRPPHSPRSANADRDDDDAGHGDAGGGGGDDHR